MVVGVKVTVILQDPGVDPSSAGIELPQVLLCANSLLVEMMLETETGTKLAFLMVIDLGALVCPTATFPKSSDFVLSLIDTIPVPLSGTVCVPAGAAGLITRLAVCVPIILGVKVTSTKQCERFAIVLGHVVLAWKSGFVVSMSVTVIGPPLPFVSFTLVSGLVVPTSRAA